MGALDGAPAQLHRRRINFVNLQVVQANSGANNVGNRLHFCHSIENDAFADRNFSLGQAETMVNPNFGAETELAPGFDITSNEEVTTKLDLAKAYEEMGDFEGARELLQEVLKEGDASHKEKAQAILAKIGE